MSAESKDLSKSCYHVIEDISAPDSSVWALLSDVLAWPQWLPTVISVAPLGAGRLEAGERFRVLQPRLLPAIWEVVSVQAGRSFVWVSKSPGLAMRASHVVEPAGAGCRLTLEFEFSGILAPLARLLAGSITERYIRTEAASLKARAEAAPMRDMSR